MIMKMKKYLIYSLMALAGFALAGCDEDYDDWSAAQAYDQESSASAYSVLSASQSSIVLDNIEEDGLVRLFSVASSDDIDGYSVNSLTVNGESVDGAYVENGYLVIDAAELAKIVEKQYFSRAAEARTLEIEATISIALSNGDSMLDEASATVSFTDYSVPAESTSGYYMLGDWQGWNLASPTVMEKQDDGTYMATVTTTSSGDNWFKFYRADSWSDSDWDIVNAGQIGCETNGDGSLQNIAVYNGDPVYADGVQTPVISGASVFEVTFDPANLTYTVARAEQMYYPTGTFTGWGSSEKYSILYPQGSNVYRISTYLSGSWDFKFWDEANFGDWDCAYYGCSTDEEMTGVTSGTIVCDYSSGIGCISSPAAGYYTCTIDMTSMTYELEEIADTPASYSSIGLCGGFNDWSNASPLEMLPLVGNDSAQDYHNWYYLGYTFETDTKLKFIADYAWAVNWGADVDVSENCYATGEQDGSDITVPAGTYNIYLNDITGDFVFVAVE